MCFIFKANLIEVNWNNKVGEIKPRNWKLMNDMKKIYQGSDVATDQTFKKKKLLQSSFLLTSF